MFIKRIYILTVVLRTYISTVKAMLNVLETLEGMLHIENLENVDPHLGFIFSLILYEVDK